MNTRLHYIFLCLLLVAGTQARAGLYVSAGPNWNNFVFEPLHEEDTPNYYGYGARLSTGYSIGQIWDLGLYGHYSPGRLKTASVTKPDATLWHAGGETGFRLGRAVYFGVRGGPANYKLLQQVEATEILGSWSGYMAQASLGLILPVTKRVMWQTTIDMGQASLKSDDDSTAKARTLSQISLTLSFVYNGQQTSSVDTAIFNNWIKNIGN